MRNIAHGSRRRRSGGHFLRRLQGSLLFSPPILLFVLALFLWQFGQIREIVIRVIEPENMRCGTQLVLGFLAFAALTAMLHFSYLSACVVLRQTGIGYGSSLVYGSEAELRYDERIVWWRDFVALLCAGMPIIAIGLAFWASSGVVQEGRELVGTSPWSGSLSPFQLCAESDAQVPAQLHRIAIIWFALSAIVLLSLIILSRLELLRGWKIGLRRPRTQRHWLMNVFAAVVLLLPIPFINLAPAFNEWLFNLIGPLATLGLVLMSSAWLLFIIGEYSRQKGIPIFLLIGIFVFVLGLYLWAKGPGDLPPQTRTLTQEQKTDAATKFQSSFISWLDKRADKSKYTRPYPVYIIASPGGGIYAASFVASVVSRLEARCPGFSQHVFAISAVSGGAIGSSIVDAMSSEAGQKPNVDCGDPKEDDTKVKLVKAMLSDDHLSPTMASTIPDVVTKLGLITFYELQRLTHLIVSQFDTGLAGYISLEPLDLRGRAEALQVSLKESVKRACDQEDKERKEPLCQEQDRSGNAKDKDGPLGIKFASAWKPNGAAPALLLNTTWAETGERIAFAPFPLSGVGDNTLTAMSELRALDSSSEKHQESLIEAAVVSARFPAVLPAMIEASHQHKYRYWWNFVDGGYADASGGTTALELYQAIEQNQAEIEKKTGLRFDLKLLLLTESTTDPQIPSGPGLSHAISPITTLLTIREQIGRRAVARVRNDLLPAEPRPDTSQASALDCDSDKRSRMYSIVLDNHAIHLPLGWMLSRHTADAIDRLVNRPDEVRYSAIARKETDTKRQNEVLSRGKLIVEENKRTFDAIRANLLNKCPASPPAP